MLLRKDEQVAADLVVLFTSSENGDCYISTSNLDGESNLKHRFALKETASSF